MTPTADASFLVSLYAGDTHTREARAWMVAHATPIVVTPALRFETENALRLAAFRQRITHEELRQALADTESDFAAGILISRDIPSARLWAECRKLSVAQTLGHGARAFDLLHVACALLVGADTFLSFDARQRAVAASVGLRAAP